MKNVVLASGLMMAALIGQAGAADLAAYQRGPSLAPPVFTWAGPYVGVTAGATFGGQNSSGYVYTDPLESPTTVTSIPGGGGHSNRFLGSVEAGVNWQSNAIVFGFEADGNFNRRSSNSSFFARTNCEIDGCSPFGVGPLYDHFVGSSRSGIGNFMTLRARAGVAVDRALFFVTGGVAFGERSSSVLSDYRLQATPTQPATYATRPDVVFRSQSENGIGFALGGGAEYAFTSNISMKAEYLYVRLGSKGSLLASNNNFGTVTANDLRAPSANIVRVGLNYRFSTQ